MLATPVRPLCVVKEQWKFRLCLRVTLTLPDVLGFDGETLRRCNDPECGNLQGLGVLQNSPTVAHVGAVYP